MVLLTALRIVKLFATTATSLRTSLTPCDMDEKFRTVICIADDWVEIREKINVKT
jgi:hypothetical protein